MKPHKIEDLKGSYNDWELLSIVGVDRHKKQIALCRCVCGREKYVRLSHLVSGATRNCGCGRTSDVTGEKHGWLVVQRSFGTDEKGNQQLECRCRCGNLKIVALDDLRCGNVKSCGCMTSEANAKIAAWLVERGFIFKTEYTDPRCRDQRMLPFDVAVWVENNLHLIEFQGWHHYHEMPKRGGVERLEITQRHDQIKANFCRVSSIPLLAIHYRQGDVMFDLIREFLGG